MYCLLYIVNHSPETKSVKKCQVKGDVKKKTKNRAAKGEAAGESRL